MSVTGSQSRQQSETFALTTFSLIPLSVVLRVESIRFMCEGEGKSCREMQPILLLFFLSVVFFSACLWFSRCSLLFICLFVSISCHLLILVQILFYLQFFFFFLGSRLTIYSFNCFFFRHICWSINSTFNWFITVIVIIIPGNYETFWWLNFYLWKMAFRRRGKSHKTRL